MLGYNINAFDIPIFNAIGDKTISIDNSKVLDVYSAFSALGNGREIAIAEQIALQHGYDSVNFGKKVKEEGLAHALGLVFGDVAHNAASDTAIVNDIVLTKDFLDGASLFDNITPKVKNGIDIFGENTVGLALSSIHYDKNGEDLMMISNNKGEFEVANEYYTSGVNRNRYYKINRIFDNNNGVVVEMTSMGSGTQQKFFKHYTSAEDASEDLRRRFIFEDKTTFGKTPEEIQKYIDRQDITHRGDTARRNYERFFGTESITSYYDSKKEETVLQGGYDRLNQYYQAYKESAVKFKEHYGLQTGELLNEQQLKEIASTDLFDDTLRTALVNAGAGYGEDGKTIAPSTLNDVKYLIGKLQDEAVIFDKLEENFKDSSMNLYQKTMVAKRFRDELIKTGGSTRESFLTARTSKGHTYGFQYARRQDLFGIELRGNINKGDDIISATVNFENERHATSQLYNTVMREARSAKSGNVNDSAMRLMQNMVRNLRDDGYVSRDFFQSFTTSFLQNNSANYQPWRYAEWIVNEVRTAYVNPLQAIGFNLSDLQNLGNTPAGDFVNILNYDDIGTVKFNTLTASHVSKEMLDTIVRRRGEERLDKKVFNNILNTNKGDEVTNAILNELGIDADSIVRSHFAETTIGKMSAYAGVFEGSAFGTRFYDRKNINDVYQKAFNDATANDFIQNQITNTGNIIYKISGKNQEGSDVEASVYDIKQKTKKLLGYDDATAEEVGRMFSYRNKNGSPFGLLTYGGKNNGEKTDFITTFFHTGVEGDNGFILINDSSDVSGYNKMLNKLTEATHDNYAKKISEITEGGYAGVFKLGAIHDHSDIFKIKNSDGSVTPLFGGRVGLDGSAIPFSFKTMDYGDKGFQKIVRQTVNTYRLNNGEDGSSGLKGIVMQATDDAFEINKWYTHTRKSIEEIMKDESLSLGERYKRVSSVVRKYQNRVVKDDVMPGLSGASTVLKIKGDYKKVQLPNMADVLQSQKINVNALKDLFIQTIADGVSGRGPEIENDLKMANFVAQFISHKDAKTSESLIYQVARDVANNRDYSFGAEFEEAFAKHLFALNIEDAEGYSKSAALPTGTIIDYLYDASKKGKYHESTTQLVQMLHRNNKVGNVSQILKEHDIEQGYISLIDPMLFVPHSHMDSTMRPVSVQQLTAGSYITKDVEKELGKDFIKKMNINLGYDAPSYQLEVLRKSMKDNFGIIPGTDLTFGDLSQGISANFKNIGSAEGMSLILEGEKKLKSLATTNYKEIAEKISKYGADVNEELTREAYNLLKNNAAYNTWESKGFLNPVFANNSYFTAPSLRKFDLNGTVSETQAEELAKLISDNNVQVTNGFNFSEFYKQHTKRDLLVTDDIGGEVPLIYHGPKGTIVGTNNVLGTTDDLIHTFTSGSGYMKEYKQGMMDAKVILGNEKMTVRILEFDEGLDIANDNIYGKMRSVLEANGITKASDQWSIIKQYAGNAFESVFGEGVAGVVNLPLDKHINATASNYMNYILNFATQSLTDNEEHNKTIFKRFDNLFAEARRTLQTEYGNSNYTGITLKTVGTGKNKRFTYDTSLLGQEGAVQQIELVADLIREDKRKYFEPLKKQLEASAEHQLYRGTMVLGINQEAKGEELYMDSRMAISLRTKGTENFEGKIIPYSSNKGFDFNAIINDEGETVLLNDYIYDRMKKESLKGIDKVKYDEAVNTVKGMYGTLHAYGKGGSYAQSNILELQLDDIIIAPEGYHEEISDYLRYGTFKFVEEKKGKKGPEYVTKYSKELQKAAQRQGVDLSKVNMLKINLSDGLTYDWTTADGSKKQMSSIFMPIMDVSPYGDDVYLTKTQRQMMRVLNTAKTFREKGVSDAKVRLASNVEDMVVSLQQEMTSKKESYFSKRLMRFKMEHSGLLFAEHTKVPVVNAAVFKRDEWLKNEQFRNDIIESVREGKPVIPSEGSKKLSMKDISMAENEFGSASFSRKIKGVIRYDDIVEMGREGFEAKGVNFATTGLDIMANVKNYKAMSTLVVDGTAKGTKDLETLLNLTAKRNRLEAEAKKFGLKDSQAALDILQGKNKFKGKGAKRKFNELKAATNEIFEEVTEAYLENVGTFGLVGRYPTFQEGSLGFVISRLNKNLSRDELTVTPMLAKRLNMDHDGDNGILKLFMEDGKLLNTAIQGGKDFDVIAKQYNAYLLSGENNKIFADMLADISKQIKENGGREVDIISAIHSGDRVYARAKTLQKTLTEKNKQAFINELKQSDFSFGSIVLETAEDIDNLLQASGNNVEYVKTNKRFEFTKDAQELINKLYTYQQKTGGNFLKSSFMKASSIKAKATKYEIGFISNPNYHINQTMNEMFTRYVDGVEKGTITEAQVDKLIQIKNILHRDNVGFLPVTEQTSIDTKHIVAGLSISETPKYSKGVKSIFNITGDAVKDRKNKFYGLTQMYESLKHNSKILGKGIYSSAEAFANDILDQTHDLQYFIDTDNKTGQMFRALIDLADLTTETERKNLTGKMATLANNVTDVYDFLEDVNAAVSNYKSGNMIAKRTTSGLLVSTLAADYDALKRNWYSVNGVLQELNAESVYFERVQVGDGKFFRTNAVTFDGVINVDDNGIYTLNFKTYSKKPSDAGSITGTASQVQAQLRQRFGSFDAVSKGEATLLLSGERKGNKNASLNFRNRIAEANAMEYLQLKAEHQLIGKNYTAKEYLSGAAGDLGYKQTKQLFTKIDKAFEGNDKAFLELRNNLRYIKSNNSMANYSQTMPFDDTLQQLNKRIIDSASGKTTSTSVDKIFQDFYKRVSGNDNIMEDFQGSVYKDFIKRQKNAGFNFKKYF